MPRGHNIILAPEVFKQIFARNPQHPRIRRHNAASNIIQIYLRETDPSQFSIDLRSSSSIPLIIRINCRNCNLNFLIRSTDLAISPICLWRIIQRRFRPSKTARNHHGVHFKTPKKHRNDTTYSKRRVNLANEQILAVTTIVQNRSTILYSFPRLHCSPHRSFILESLHQNNKELQQHGIPHYVIWSGSRGDRSKITLNGASVSYMHHRPLRNLDDVLKGGLKNLDRQLGNYLLSTSSKKDWNREDGKINTLCKSLVTSIDYGFGRVQSATNRRTWLYKDVKQPTLDVEPFLAMPITIRKKVMLVMERASDFAIENNNPCFSDTIRSCTFASMMNKRMGFPESVSKFEYVNIIISSNTQIKEHIDWKNDHRAGYDICIVYSSFVLIDNIEYRLAIVMTTRTTVGAALEKARANM